jgi:hypothetical protein
MSAETNNTLQTFELYISQADSLLTTGYRDGKDKKEELYNNATNLILKTFPDGKERLTKLKQSFPISSGILETEREKQEIYISYLKAIRNTLVDNKEELQPRTPKEDIINQPVQSKKDEKQEEETKTPFIAIEEVARLPRPHKETLVANKEELQSRTPKENIRDEPYSALASALNLLSERARVDQINLEILDLKKESESTINKLKDIENKLKDLDQINLEILDLKKDIQNIKSGSNNLSVRDDFPILGS